MLRPTEPPFLCEERLGSLTDLVTNITNPFDGLFLRILERPIVSLEAGHDGAGLSASHRHEDVTDEASSSIASSTSGCTREPGWVPAEIAVAFFGSATSLDEPPDWVLEQAPTAT